MPQPDVVKIFTDRIDHLLAEYETGKREPQRTMEIIACLCNGLGEKPMHLPLNIQMILVVVHAWNRGDRPDVDALATISALSRLQGWHLDRPVLRDGVPLTKSASLAH